MQEQPLSSKLRSQSWFDQALYPFTSNHLRLPIGTMHYVDEGQGEPIVFVHGTPTWSFLYRDHIKALSKHYRCIAPDHIGFGLSDKPSDWDYTPASHAANLEALIDHLNLDNITLVVHDFGGPIGLSYALRHPDKIKRIVIFNTWLWETKQEKAVQQVDKILNSALGRFLYLNLNFSPRVLLKQGFAKKKLTKAVHKHYLNVFPKRNDRFGLLRIGLALVGASDWYHRQWKQLHRLSDKPILMLWGMKDAFLKPPFLEKWLEVFPQTQTIRYDCGHFVQEEETASTRQGIKAFMNDESRTLRAHVVSDIPVPSNP